MDDHQHTEHVSQDRKGVKFGASSKGHKVEFGYDTEESYRCVNSKEGEKRYGKSQRASDKRKRVAQGATAGFFAGGLTGGGVGTGVGAGIGAIIGSIVPGPGTLIGAAVGATIGGIVGVGTVGGAGVAAGTGIAAAMSDDKD